MKTSVTENMATWNEKINYPKKGNNHLSFFIFNYAWSWDVQWGMESTSDQPRNLGQLKEALSVSEYHWAPQVFAWAITRGKNEY